MSGLTPESVRFLIAGVQKAGTSALFDYLRDVPSLQLPDVKEAHFFDDETIDWGRPDYRRYHDLFVDDGRLWGEATPIYCYWPNSLERIRAYAPDMRIILIFRDPIERAWSHWKMEYAKGKEREPFAWCIREGRARLDYGDSTETVGSGVPGHHRVFSYVERGLYSQQVDRLWRLFPQQQTLLVLQQDLNSDPNGVVARICNFLDVAPPAERLTARRVREAADMAYPSALTNEDRAFLADVYREDTVRFAHLTGLDLSGWSSV
jgi:hypothetical protein